MFKVLIVILSLSYIIGQMDHNIGHNSMYSFISQMYYSSEHLRPVASNLDPDHVAELLEFLGERRRKPRKEHPRRLLLEMGEHVNRVIERKEVEELHQRLDRVETSLDRTKEMMLQEQIEFGLRCGWMWFNPETLEYDECLDQQDRDNIEFQKGRILRNEDVGMPEFKYENGELRLIDGFHRIMAYRELGIKLIKIRLIGEGWLPLDEQDTMVGRSGYPNPAPSPLNEGIGGYTKDIFTEPLFRPKARGTFTVELPPLKRIWEDDGYTSLGKERKILRKVGESA